MDTKKKPRYIHLWHWRKYPGERKGIAHLAFRLILAFGAVMLTSLIMVIVDIAIPIPETTFNTLMVIASVLSAFTVGILIGIIILLRLVRESLSKDGLDIKLKARSGYLIPSPVIAQKTPEPQPNLTTLSKHEIYQLAHEKTQVDYVWYTLVFIAVATIIYNLVSPLGYEYISKVCLGLIIAAYIGCALWERRTKREARAIEATIAQNRLFEQ